MPNFIAIGNAIINLDDVVEIVAEPAASFVLHVERRNVAPNIARIEVSAEEWKELRERFAALKRMTPLPEPGTPLRI